jgi:hypothetical protein
MTALSSRRQRLPARRRSETFELECAGLRYTATIARFRDGRIAEMGTGIGAAALSCRGAGGNHAVESRRPSQVSRPDR